MLKIIVNASNNVDTVENVLCIENEPFLVDCYIQISLLMMEEKELGTQLVKLLLFTEVNYMRNGP